MRREILALLTIDSQLVGHRLYIRSYLLTKGLMTLISTCVSFVLFVSFVIMSLRSSQLSTAASFVCALCMHLDQGSMDECQAGRRTSLGAHFLFCISLARDRQHTSFLFHTRSSCQRLH